jgi:hypothetical protein
MQLLGYAKVLLKDENAEVLCTGWIHFFKSLLREGFRVSGTLCLMDSFFQYVLCEDF